MPTSPIFYNIIIFPYKFSLISFEGTTDYFSTKINQDNLIPNRLLFGFTDTDAVITGNYTKNPFNFQNYNITEIDLREGTSSYPVQH